MGFVVRIFYIIQAVQGHLSHHYFGYYAVSGIVLTMLRCSNENYRRKHEKGKQDWIEYHKKLGMANPILVSLNCSTYDSLADVAIYGTTASCVSNFVASGLTIRVWYAVGTFNTFVTRVLGYVSDAH